MTRVVGYMRELRWADDAKDAAQTLRRAGAEKIYTDPLSAGDRDRSQLVQCLAALERGDILIVPDAVHLSHSVDHFVTTATSLAVKGISLRSLREPALSTDQTRQEGSIEVLAALDELRSRLAGLRTAKGLDAAATRGRKPGRPRVMTDERVAVARELRDHGRSFAQIGRALGVSEAAARRAVGASARARVEHGAQPHRPDDFGLTDLRTA